MKFQLLNREQKTRPPQRQPGAAAAASSARRPQVPRVTCSYCSKQLSSKKYLQVHVRRRHTFEKPYSCQCGSQFHSAGDLWTHKQRRCVLRTSKPPRRAKSRVECTWPGCGQNFASKVGLTSHVQACHELRKPHTCGYCGKAFARTEGLTAHVQLHTGEKPSLMCPEPECGLRFRGRDKLRIHTRQRHTGERPYKCDVCGKGFACSSSLGGHRRAHARSALSCSAAGCDKTFLTASGLRLHIKSIHDNNRPYECQCCHKKFLLATQLADHVRTHTGEKPFACGTCSSRFSSHAGLSAHVKQLHSDERPHACHTCPKKFKLAAELKNHLETHKLNQDRRHTSCPQCGKQVLHHSLRGHMATHAEPTVQCPYCVKRFTDKNGLSKHLVVHTGEKAGSCGVCGLEFGLKSNLARHMKKVHN